MLCGAGYFFMSINILELCSGETIWFFQGLLLFGGIRAAFSVAVIWLNYRGSTFLSTLPDAPWVRRFPVWLVGGWTLPGPLRALRIFLSSSFVWVFPASGAFLVCMCWSILRWIFQRDPLKSLKPFSLCSLFLPMTLSVHTLPSLELQLLLHSGRLPGSTWVSLPELLPWNSLQTVSWDSGRAHLIFQLWGIIVLWWLMSNVYKWSFHIFSSLFYLFHMEGPLQCQELWRV